MISRFCFFFKSFFYIFAGDLLVNEFDWTLIYNFDSINYGYGINYVFRKFLPVGLMIVSGHQFNASLMWRVREMFKRKRIRCLQNDRSR